MKVTGAERPKNWLSAGKISEHCQVSTATVRRWIKCGDSPAIRLPRGHYRVSVSDFISFLKRHNLPIEEALLRYESDNRERND